MRVQQRLAGRVVSHDTFTDINCVAGVDVGFEDGGKVTRAAVAVLEYPSLQTIDQAVARTATRFPYVPGLLSFREIPALLEAFRQLRTAPDMILCDGQGYAHPRRFGLACHLGLILEIPAIGVAKTRLVGTHGRVPEKRGSWCPLTDKNETIGAVLRTRVGVRPVYISVGHRICLESAVHYVMACTTRYRLPETTRCAHRLASL